MLGLLIAGFIEGAADSNTVDFEEWRRVVMELLEDWIRMP